MHHFFVSIAAAALLLAAPAARAATIRASGHLGVSIVRHSAMPHGGAGMANDLLESPWLAINGRESLGSGLATVFKVSTSLQLPTGEFSGRLDDVQLGLDSPRYGRITAGRQYPEAIQRISDSLDVFEVSGSSVHALPLALLATNPFTGYTGRANRSVNYRTTLGGFVVGLSVAAPADAGLSRSAAIGLALRGCELGAAWLDNDGGTAYPGAAQRFAGVGGNCRFHALRLYATIYDRELRAANGQAAQHNRIVHLGIKGPLTKRVSVSAGIYADRGDSLGCVPGRDGRKTTEVAAIDYAFSANTRITLAAFANLMSNSYRDDPLNVAALGGRRGAAAVRGSAVTLGVSF